MGWNDLIGQRLEHYEILAELGRGGSSRVYRAFDTEHQRDVAIKVIPNDAEDRTSFLSRFEREVEAVQKLHHPHIVAVFGSGENDDLVYLVMQCISGGTLRKRLKEQMSMREAIAYVIQMAHALQHAHEQGIVHRDVKPSNMLVDADHPDQLLLTDFGIAKIQGARQLTKSGTTIGTPEYMAPEQAEGHEIDNRADIYALGCVLYEALAGRPPFMGVTPVSVLYQQVHSRPAYIRGFNPEVSRELAHVLEVTLSKRPEERFATADEFAGALLPFLDVGLGAAILPTHSPVVPPVASTWVGLSRHSPQMQELPTVSGPLWPGVPAPGEQEDVQSVLASPTPTEGLPAASVDVTERDTSHETAAVRKRRQTVPMLSPSFRLPTRTGRRQSVPDGWQSESMGSARLAPNLTDMDETARRYSLPIPAAQARQELAEPGYNLSDWDEQPTGSTFVQRAASGLPVRAGIAVVSCLMVLLVAWIAVSASGVGLTLGSKAQATATTRPAATVTVTASPAPTKTTSPKSTATPDIQRQLNAQAAAYFRSVTLATFRDGSCAASNATSNFNQGQGIYVNLCRSNAGSGNYTISIQQNGNVVTYMTTNFAMSPGSSYYFYSHYSLAPGNYALVVTTPIGGKTAIARSMPFHVG